MTLASIYAWMSCNVPGLYEKRNLHSSKGWKNAVRHTLSVNRRFKKISQPNVRAALWTIVSEEDVETSQEKDASSIQEDEDQPSTSELPSCSSDTVAITVSPVSTSYLINIPTPSTSSSKSSILYHTDNETCSELDRIQTQTLELHHQDGTVRTVTVPKPYPIHVVGDYRVITIDTTNKPQVVTKEKL